MKDFDTTPGGSCITLEDRAWYLQEYILPK